MTYGGPRGVEYHSRSGEAHGLPHPFTHDRFVAVCGMKKLLCPQCKIAAMYVKNEQGERLLVYVLENGEVVPKYPEDSMEGFDLTEVFCLGCSWHGSPKRLVKR